jgi:divalent metal cation (Fe/Co/Zn/Cd) transporter
MLVSFPSDQSRDILGLAVGKGCGGYFGNSQAMIADAAHSLSDLITDAVTLWSHRFVFVQLS